MINNLHVEWVCRSAKIVLYNAWAQIRDDPISYTIPNRHCADGHSAGRAEEVKQFLQTPLPHLCVCMWGECVWSVAEKTTTNEQTGKKFCLVPPTFPSSCAILALLAVLLHCKKYLKAKSLSLVMTLLWYCVLWQVWIVAFLEHQSSNPAQSEASAETGQERISLGGQTWLTRELGSAGRGSWLHIKEPVHSTCRFLGSCFLSDNNNKSNFRAFSACLFLVL